MKKLAALLATLTGVAVTANGYRPLTKDGYGSLYAFAAGVFATELPLTLIAGQSAALAAVSRWLSPRARKVSWLLSALSWLGLAGLDRIGRQADQPLTAALDAELGTDRRSSATGVWSRTAAGVPAVKPAGVVRTMGAVRHYVHAADVSYGRYGSRNHLDIWRHPDLAPDAKAPVLLQVPGGAWMVGSKRHQAYPLLSHLVNLGWVCVSINYRLSPRSTWPDHIVDVKQALAWTKENIADYGGDPDWVAITGGSAGGHLSALAALTPNRPEFQPGFEDADTSVRAAVPFYGVYDMTGTVSRMHPLLVPALQSYVFKQSRRRFPDVYQASSPVSYVGPDAPPFFVLHGRNDSLVPVEQGRDFAARLREASHNPVVYAELPYAQHAFEIFGSPRAHHTARAVEQFLAEVYAPVSSLRATASAQPR
ncbi:alpha/beta hydrolase [Mycobacterium koreense]|uniref:Esterase n=1 Tax=Mycolicibacillus koreensis TaxID=1069220 RepID=A0A7I7S9T8_9MYCO|nr:alpha/beta hydrolase [Mycolicibacillus koreensis]MCV7248823.1 alpha/beta hydrolase [Mycolicibacillus koreensis]OSC36061.1 esterase [Mycolicibacillus koreensis]BBY53667.1 esterase [Mycolicibacillus koreensis]